MKAITTKYIGPTNTRSSRIIAFDSDKNRISIPYPHELSGEAVHLKAAIALRDKMKWKGTLVGGATKTGYVFVFAPDILKKNPRKRVKKNPSTGIRIVHNKLLGGWFVVRGPHQTPLNGRFDSKAEAQAWLQQKKNPRKRIIHKKYRHWYEKDKPISDVDRIAIQNGELIPVSSATDRNLVKYRYALGQGMGLVHAGKIYIYPEYRKNPLRHKFALRKTPAKSLYRGRFNVIKHKKKIRKFAIPNKKSYNVYHQSPNKLTWGLIAFFPGTPIGKAFAIDYAKRMKARNRKHSFKVIEK